MTAGGESIQQALGRVCETLPPAPQFSDDPALRQVRRLAASGLYGAMHGGEFEEPQTVSLNGRAQPRLALIPTPDSIMSFEDVIPSAVGNTPEGWDAGALCKQFDPGLFFPETGASINDIRKAKAICQGCDARKSCLEWALKEDERFGIWGGYDYRERRRIKRMNGQVATPEFALPLKEPYSRVKQLVDILQGNDSQEELEDIENTLHEDEERLTRFVQKLLTWYESESPKNFGKGTASRLMAYFTGQKIWSICHTPIVEKVLGKEIKAMTDFSDDVCKTGYDPLIACWNLSRPSEPTLRVRL